MPQSPCTAVPPVFPVGPAPAAPRPHPSPAGRGRHRPMAAALVLPAVALVLLPLALPSGALAQDRPAPTPAQVLDAAPESAWRSLDPENTVHMTLETGDVVLWELAPEFAPRHVENIRAMIRARMFDGGAVVRSQENYVVQWAANPALDADDLPPSIATELAGEFAVAMDGIPFTALPDGDVYAPEVGFSRGFPVAREPSEGLAWIVHCPGVVGVARGNAPDSGNGSSLYAVIGHAPRHLDRNLSMPGRILEGVEHLSTLARGTEPLGFYATPGEQTGIRSVRLGAQLPPGERSTLQVLRTDSPSFRDWIAARRNRSGEWWVHDSGRVDVCNVTVPTRDPSLD